MKIYFCLNKRYVCMDGKLFETKKLPKEFIELLNEYEKT